MPRLLRRLLATALTALSLLVVAATAAVTTGHAGIVATHGVSMNPVYYQGDLVVIARGRSYRAGQIVGYHRPGHSDLVLHRIVGGNARGFVFKGDNNASIDPTRPTQGQLAGRAVLHIPHGGLWLHHLTSPTGLGLLTVALLAVGRSPATTRRQRRRARMSKHASHARLPRTVRALPPVLRTGAIGLAVVALLGSALAAFAWTTPVTAPVTDQRSLGSQVTFAYTAAVGRTAAYDGTIATSPDPVFRKLAHTVEVHYTYTGDPGSVSVTAALSTAAGWHSTLRLAPPTAFNGSPNRGSVTLNLAALDTRAHAAAIAAGLPESPLSITITPRIQTADGATFTPSLRLTLTPQQLALAGGADTLTVTNPHPPRRAAVAGQRLRMVGAYGVHVTVGRARTIAATLLLTAVLAVVLLWLFARGMTLNDEGGDIRRRYAPQLVQVHPMTAPSHRPAIDVATFPTLAKLAERYGLLILHWSRSGVETFLVQDEATTYRYRTGARTAASDTEATDTVEADAG